MLMLGREIEVPLDVTTESTPHVEPPSTEYWLAHKRQRGDTKQRRLSTRKEMMTSDYPASLFGLVTVFGCTIFDGRKAGIPS